MVLQAKKQACEEFGRKMKVDSQDNQKLFYRVLKKLSKGNEYTLKQVEGKDKIITYLLTWAYAIMEQWREYFRELLNEDEQSNIIYEKTTDVMQKNVEVRIKKEEVTEIITTIKRGKSIEQYKNVKKLSNR